MRPTCLISALLVLGLAGPVLAEPIGGKEARRLVYAPDKAEVTVIDQPFLDETAHKILVAVGVQQPYYGAIAASPSEGLMANSIMAAANYHAVGPAREAALKGCDSKRNAGSASCVIVAEIRPEGWQARGFQLSAEATRFLRKEYRRAGKVKALAISQARGSFGLGKGAGAAAAALADCAAGGARDCALAVTDGLN